MIRLVKDGEDLDLSDGTIRWETVNSLFEENVFQSDYTFPFTLPPSNKNKRLLGFLHMAEVPNKKVKFQVLLFVGSRSIKCKLIVNGTNGKGYDASVAAGIFGLDDADNSLKGLPFDGDGDGAVGTVDLKPTFAYAWTIYKTTDWKNRVALPPHYNPDFYGDSNPDFQGVVNRMDTVIGTMCLNDISGPNKYTLVPFLYIHYILKTIFETRNGLKITGTYWDDEEVSNALLYNNYSLDAEQSVDCKVKLGEDVFLWVGSDTVVPFRNDVSGANDPGGVWNNGTGKYDSAHAGDYAMTANLKFKIDLPSSFPAAVYVRIRIYSSILGMIYTNGLDGVPYDVNTIYNVVRTELVPGASFGEELYITVLPWVPSTSDRAPFILYKDESYLEVSRYDDAVINLMNPIITLKNHVPDVTISEFLKWLKGWAEIEITINWDDKSVDLNYISETLKRPRVQDVTRFAAPNPIVLFDNKNPGFLLNYGWGTSDKLVEGNFKEFDKSLFLGFYNTKFDLPTPFAINKYAVVINTNKVMVAKVDSGTIMWMEYTDYYYPIRVGDAGKLPVIDLAPMLMTDIAANEASGGTVNDMVALMPTIKETGSSQLFNLGINDWSTRVVFMRGMNGAGTYGGNYILASSSNIDINGNVCGNYKLKLQDDDGMYLKWHERIMLAIDNSEVYEYLILLGYGLIDYRSIVQIKNVNYLIKNISMPLGSTIKRSVVKLLKI